MTVRPQILRKNQKFLLWSIFDGSHDTIGGLVGFSRGRIRIFFRPFFQSPRYVALVASTGLRNEREVFFVYDSQSKKIFTYPVKKSFPHIHENIFIMGDVAFFAACKTRTPVGRLNLTTGQITAFGTPAPQSASFYVVGSDVLVKGSDKIQGGGQIYRVGEKNLIQVDTVISKDNITEMSFDKILKNTREESNS